MAVALFLKGLARRISFHFNSVPVRQRACQAWSPAECRGTEEARRVAQHGRSRECFSCCVSVCDLCPCAHIPSTVVSLRERDWRYR